MNAYAIQPWRRRRFGTTVLAEPPDCRRATPTQVMATLRSAAAAMSKQQITSLDVARLAAVSQSAVSRSFTPGASVAPETRARVLEAARKLGYRPNAIARTLSTRRSRMIAVVVSNLQNQFYPVVIETLSQRLQKDRKSVV